MLISGATISGDSVSGAGVVAPPPPPITLTATPAIATWVVPDATLVAATALAAAPCIITWVVLSATPVVFVVTGPYATDADFFEATASDLFLEATADDLFLEAE